MGTIKNGKWGHLLSLPPSCRPDKRLIFNLNNDDSTSRVDVQVDGRVLWVGGEKRHGHISLTGITFAVRDTLATSTTLPSQYSPVYSKQTTGNCEDETLPKCTATQKDHVDGHCPAHKKNGGCSSNNLQHVAWWARCPVTCGQCNEAVAIGAGACRRSDNGVAYYGNEKVANLKGCSNKCRDDSECRAFAFRVSDGDCWLYKEGAYTKVDKNGGNAAYDCYSYKQTRHSDKTSVESISSLATCKAAATNLGLGRVENWEWQGLGSFTT